jgi:hypothetical protein
MNKKDLCKILEGREYPLHMASPLEDIIKENNLVVVFGASDDLMEFRGAITGEVGAYNGTTACLSSEGLLISECGESEACPYHIEIKKLAKTITALWCVDPEITWTYETEIPHETFLIMEEGEKYCRGIVFDLGDV